MGTLLYKWFGKSEVVETAPVERKNVDTEPVSLVSAEEKKPEPAVTKPEPKRTTTAKDNLKRIKGIGPTIEAKLNGIDITTFAQIASWQQSEIDEVSTRLSFPGRIEREDWVNQAKMLASGGETSFSKRVDKGDVDSSTGTVTQKEIGKAPELMSSAPDKGGDNLTLIDGVGNALEQKLNKLGVYTFDQISKWTADNEAWVGNQMGFPGRSERENWVAEAKTLAAGGTTKHSASVERGEIKSSRKSD